MPIDTIVLNAAYISLVSGSLNRDMVRLRILMMAAAAAFISYGAINGIWSMVAWNVVIAAMHGRRLLALTGPGSTGATPAPVPVEVRHVRVRSGVSRAAR